MDLNAELSFTFVKPPQTIRAAINPLGEMPAKCTMVMSCKPHMLDRERSPISVTEQYDKFICNETHMFISATEVKHTWYYQDLVT